MPSTADRGQDLLVALSDAELARYGEIARDQAKAELSRWWVQAGLLLGSIAAFWWATAKWGIAGSAMLGVEPQGFGRWVVLPAALGAALAYPPYRRVRGWTMWNRHCKAVRDEQMRRRGAGQGD